MSCKIYRPFLFYSVNIVSWTVSLRITNSEFSYTSYIWIPFGESFRPLIPGKHKTDLLNLWFPFFFRYLGTNVGYQSIRFRIKSRHYGSFPLEWKYYSFFYFHLNLVILSCIFFFVRTLRKRPNSIVPRYFSFDVLFPFSGTGSTDKFLWITELQCIVLLPVLLKITLFYNLILACTF